MMMWQGEWQTVDTAPKDGDENENVEVLWFHPEMGMAVHSIHTRFDGCTHWRPLPPPPESE